MEAVVQFFLSNWPLIATALGGMFVAFAAIAELTPWTWDNIVVKLIRQIWAFVPVGETDPKKMGWGNPNAK